MRSAGFIAPCLVVLWVLMSSSVSCVAGGEGAISGECGDGVDNDTDGQVDCADEGCIGDLDCVGDDDDDSSVGDDDDSSVDDDDDDSSVGDDDDSSVDDDDDSSVDDDDDDSSVSDDDDSSVVDDDDGSGESP